MKHASEISRLAYADPQILMVQLEELDLLRIHIRLHDVKRFIGTSKLLLRVTSPLDATSFALPTGSGDTEYVVMLPGLDVQTAKPFVDNRSIYLVILVVANSNSILTYSISVKIYDRSQYNVILRPPKFYHSVSKQKTLALIPAAFRVDISDVSIRMLKISVNSNDNSCAWIMIRKYSTAFLHTRMLAVNSSMLVSFTRKASLVLLVDSPLHVFIMMNDDRACSIFAPTREYNHRKRFDIKFSIVESISIYPLVATTVFYLILVAIFLGSDQLMPPLHCSQGETDIPLIVLLDENSLEASSGFTQQKTIRVNDSQDILVDIQMDKDKQQPVKDIELLKATKQRSVSTDTNEIVMQSFESNWKDYIPYFAWLPVILQYFYTLLLDQLTLMTDSLDVCHYNMECSVALGPFVTFNHMFSNVGYLLFGFVFIVLISRRYKYCKYRRCDGYNYCPQVFLNIGLMMCLETFASAFYHICPNPRTFHNDTLFVEIALVLLMVRFYFVRRGGISLNRIFHSITFAIGFHFASNALTLAIILTSGLLLLIAFQYHLFLGSQSSIESIPTRDWRKWLHCWQLLIRNERDKSSILKKILLVCNIALVLLFETGLLQTSYITLYIIVLNSTGYFIYYISCKIINGETISTYSFVYVIASFLLWIAAFYFFNHGKNDWTLTAAQNRAIAEEECKVFQYFDSHDIWHLISSLASFFSLLTIAVLDDDIMIFKSDFDRRLISTF
uniref:SID1 transmembrane family member 1 n=1 Tax=Wuchereria bancrofti TaxID=6293 RepID=A0AAF5PT29_WUCBA